MQERAWWMACLCFAGCLTPACATAQGQGEVDVEALVKQVQELAEANRALTERVVELENRLAESEQPPAPQAPTEQAAQADAAAARVALRTYWDDGLRFETPDQAFRLKIGGRVMFDAGFFDSPNYWSLGGAEIDEHDGTEVRRLRLNFSGQIYGDYLYEVEVGFADDEPDVIDAYVGMKGVPVLGTLRAGQFSEPLGLEALTSANHLTFLERSMPTQAFVPYRSRGLGFSNQFLDKRLTLAGGVFNGGVDQDNHWNVTARLTGTPWYANEGRRVLHLGVGWSHRNPESEYGFYARPGSHLANKHLNTGELPADEVDLRGAEAALVLGPFSIQGEFLRADVDFLPEPRDLTIFDLDRFFTLEDRHFDGYYVQASYFLTGEHRVYDPATACFDRVVPRNRFRLRGGTWGAWEVAARYDELGLDDFDVRSGVIGGEGHNLTLGLNWYLTPNVRLMMNYVKSHVDQFAYEGDIDIWQTRFQADF